MAPYFNFNIARQPPVQAWQITIVFLGLLLALLCSCSIPNGTSDRQYFDYNLHGIWEKTNSEPCEYPPCLPPKIMIDYDYLIIIGDIHHFGNLPKEVRLEGYSKDSLIYVSARGEWQPPISYRIWEEAGPYPRAKILTLRGGTFDDEDFKRVSE